MGELFRQAQALETERVVIATCMDSPDAYRSLAGKLTLDHFTDSTCKGVWRAMCDMDDAGESWTVASLLGRLSVENAGAVVWYSGLPAPEPGPVSIGLSVEELVAAERMRKIQSVAVNLASMPFSQRNATRCVSDALEVLGGLAELTQAVGPEKVQDVALRVAKAGAQSESGTPTGWPRFDQRCGGLFGGRLYVVGARPSSGKTACATTWALNSANAGARVLLLTTETSKEVASSRVLSQTSGEDSYLIRTGKSNANLVVEGLRRLPDSMLVEDAAMGVGEIRALIAAERRAWSGPLVVFVDYLELVRPARRNKSRETEVSEIIQALHWEAKRAKVAMVVMSQLSRKAEETQKGKASVGPSMADLRYSGMIEQAADCIVLLHRPTEEETGDVLAVKARVAKNKVSGAEFGLDLTMVKSRSLLAEASGNEPAGMVPRW